MTADVVLTLDSELRDDRSAVWCASFQLAWNELRGSLIGDRVRVEAADAMVDSLNSESLTENDLPEGSCFAVAGLVRDGIVQRIQKEMAERFPFVSTPTFPLGSSLIAYAYLETGAKFGVPFFENRQPLLFHGANGSTAEVKSFGIRAQDAYAYRRLREQVEVLHVHRSRDPKQISEPAEFILDLDRYSSPNQIIVACIPRQPTLADALAYCDSRIGEFRGTLEHHLAMHYRAEELKRAVDRIGRLGSNDTVLVPDIFLDIDARLSQIEGKRIINSPIEGLSIDVAQQVIKFRLDRGGAELKSEAKSVVLPIPSHFQLNRPFLLYMRRRGVSRPFVSVWVGGPELLEAFHSSRD
jgi:hypothetical protein